MGANSVTVVVPVLNEEDNIRPQVQEIMAALGHDPDLEIVYVDDGSDDATPRILAELAAELPQFRYVRHQVRCGQSTAVRTGVMHASNRWVATLDGDCQNDPADIPAMLAKLLEPGANSERRMVAGWRQKRNDTWLRRFSSRYANRIRAGLLKDDTPDTGCGLKVFGRDLFLSLPYFNHMHRFLPALVLRAGGEVFSVRVNHRHRTMGTSKYGFFNRLWVGIVDILGVMWLQRRAKVPVVEFVSPKKG